MLSSGNSLGHDGARSIVDSLTALRRLSSLDASNNNLGSAGAASVATALARSQCAIESICLEENGVTEEAKAEIEQIGMEFNVYMHT